MQIIRANEAVENNMEKLYNLCMSPETQKLSIMEGEVIEFSDYCIYSDVDAKGNENTVLAILTTDGYSYATNSATCIKDFGRILDLAEQMNSKFSKIKIIGGESKNGRHFITCAFAG